MGFSEYEDYDGVGLAELVRNGEVTSGELIDAMHARLERWNPHINAVVHDMTDAARRLATEAPSEGAFAGVPFLLKDLMALYRGEPISSGSRMFAGYVAPFHSELVKRFLSSGVVVCGKTNTPELGLMPTTEPELHGPCRNPWDLRFSAGGSSGGSAAAVAARIVPMASGGDGGGSIRIPASCTGTFGLKPTRGRNPMGPHVGDCWQGFVAEHVQSLSVRDSAAMLDVTQGADVGAYYSAPANGNFLQSLESPPPPLRVAFSAHPYLGGKVHDDCQRALQHSVSLLQDLGHTCVEGYPEIDGLRFSRNFLVVICGEIWSDLQLAARATGKRLDSSLFEHSTWFGYQMGQSFHAGELAQAVSELKTVHRQIATYMEDQDIDVLLSPTLATPPAVLGSLHPPQSQVLMEKLIGALQIGSLVKRTRMFADLAAELYNYIPYTPVANVSGQPSMSVPLYWNSAGLPIGTMFTGRFAQESTLLQLARQLEQAQPWRDRRPPSPPA